jgi:hypothetical protein
MAQVSGVHQVVFALREHGADMEREIGREVWALAEQAVQRMKRRVAKGHTSGLVNSIVARQVDALTWDAGPKDKSYAWQVEHGVKPGGKGLPRFFDLKSKSIVDWLQSKAPSRFMGPQPQYKKRGPRKGSKLFTAAEMALRDRYEGLALHVRNHGIKAQPFVEPTAKEMEPIVLKRLNLAVRRVLAARPDAGGALA